MAKRFCDTEIYKQSWFRKLSPKMKCAFRFLCDSSDSAGVWLIDMEQMSFCVGEDIAEDELFLLLNKDQKRIEKLAKDKIWLTGFIEFQYGELSENCKPHKPIIQKLKKLGLYERVLKGYPKGIDTLQEKETYKEKEKEQETDNAEVEQLFTASGLKPGAEHMNLVLDQIEIFQVIEFMKLHKQIDLKEIDVKNKWEAFKLHHFNGVKHYNNLAEIKKHFRDWLNYQRYEKSTNKKRSGLAENLNKVDEWYRQTGS